jgi:hypothetical protein
MHCWTTSIERLLSKNLRPLTQNIEPSQGDPERNLSRTCKVPTGFFLMATPALAICSILEFLYLPTLPPLGSLEAAKNQIPVPEKTITAAFAYKLFTTLHLMVCKFQILPPNIDLP